MMTRAPRLGQRALRMALGFVLVGSAQRVAASELVLEWHAPEGCPDREQLALRVSRLVGDVVKSNLTAATDVTRTDAAYRARLRITSAAGFAERTLENTRCDILVDSVALVIALSADAPDGEATNSSGSDLALSASASVSALLGPLPQPALGIGAAIGVEGFSSLRVELHGTYYLAQSTTFEQITFARDTRDQRTLGADLDLLAFGARGCRTWSFGAFDLGPCVGAEVYHIRASGFGAMVSRDGDSTWWGPAVGMFGRLRLVSAFALDVAVEGIAPLSRQRLMFSDIGPVHRASVIALRVLVASEARF